MVSAGRLVAGRSLAERLSGGIVAIGGREAVCRHGLDGEIALGSGNGVGLSTRIAERPVGGRRVTALEDGEITATIGGPAVTRLI